MPRRARVRVSELPLHVIQRGNNRSACFRADVDFMVYLQHLEALSRELESPVHAYVLMTNHVHLLLTPAGCDSASLLMKNLAQRYAQYFNKRHGRTGSLWEGRFRSSVVDTERYFLACQRYIELNPVRAGMVARPEDYVWSSYAANALGKRNPVVVAHPQYLALGMDDTSRRHVYKGLFEHAMPTDTLERIRTSVNGGYVLGDSDFEARLRASHGNAVTRGSPGRPRKSTRQEDLFRIR